MVPHGREANVDVPSISSVLPSEARAGSFLRAFRGEPHLTHLLHTH